MEGMVKSCLINVILRLLTTPGGLLLLRRAFSAVPICNFWTREGKTFRQCEKPMKFGANGLEVVEFQRTQNPKLHPPVPISDLDARVEVKQRICLHWDLASRQERKLKIPRVGEEENQWEEFCDLSQNKP
ncbi:hypothetical protein AVEN_40223-1 [Araneus ventricosus]|uniref:Uncharacterized protein n=1 Tax=Araneus ventricosus TaxID=182803 RepID=A0A4Y2UCI0_ARAVE|nr:hypothetical protein AVEN_132049-1 [Araneus ventricosus]GBO10348.1 hypothetical protein AVEN_40223-1 [Araneus ventricosus]